MADETSHGQNRNTGLISLTTANTLKKRTDDYEKLIACRLRVGGLPVRNATAMRAFLS